MLNISKIGVEKKIFAQNDSKSIDTTYGVECWMGMVRSNNCKYFVVCMKCCYFAIFTKTLLHVR